MTGEAATRIGLPALLALALAALLAAGCGDDEEPASDAGQPAEVTALEESLEQSISDVREEEPAIEAIDCPGDAELSAMPAELTCTIAGGGEAGSVEVTVSGNEFDYTGQFAGSAFGGSGNEF